MQISNKFIKYALKSVKICLKKNMIYAKRSNKTFVILVAAGYLMEWICSLLHNKFNKPKIIRKYNYFQTLAINTTSFNSVYN